MAVRPKVFVGSSSEAETIDRQVRSVLETFGAAVVGWREVFRPGDYPLEALLRIGASVDAALLIASPDDLTNYRGGERLTPRDNVLLELGMFLSLFGKRRTGILHVRASHGAASLPSDLHGVTTLLYDPSQSATNETQLRIWLDGVRDEIEHNDPALPHLLDELRTVFRAVPSAWRTEIDRYVLSSFVAALKQASQGQIVLTPGQYYQAIYDEIDQIAAPAEVLGVVTLASPLWTDDRDQLRYVRKNTQAAQRGVSIRRLFIVPDHEWPRFHGPVKELLSAGISVRRARPAIVAEATVLEDMVLFVDKTRGTSRAYVAEPAFDNPGRIRRGRLLLNADDRGALRDIFERVWTTASEMTARDIAKPRTSGDQAGRGEPGRSMRAYSLARPVVSCAEAAMAKGIPIANELKSLIISTAKGMVALHLPGDSEANLRAVKQVLEVREASLASPEELSALGLSPGIVCAVKAPTWDLPHLVSRRVMQMEYVSTNNGTHRGFYRFHPAVFYDADSLVVGEFERSK